MDTKSLNSIECAERVPVHNDAKEIEIGIDPNDPQVPTSIPRLID